MLILGIIMIAGALIVALVALFLVGVKVGVNKNGPFPVFLLVVATILLIVGIIWIHNSAYDQAYEKGVIASKISATPNLNGESGIYYLRFETQKDGTTQLVEILNHGEILVEEYLSR